MKTVKTDETKNFQTGHAALLDAGFTYVNTLFGPFNSVTKSAKAYEVYQDQATGKHYAYAGMHHYNTTVFNVKLKPVSVDDLYDYEPQR